MLKTPAPCFCSKDGVGRVGRCHLEENVSLSVQPMLQPNTRCKPRSATGDFLRCLLPLEVTRRRCPRATSGLVSPCRQRVWQAIGQHLSETYETLSMLSIFYHASKQSECEHSCFEVEISVYLLVLLACFTEFTIEI